jgi:hypothetical protein
LQYEKRKRYDDGVVKRRPLRLTLPETLTFTAITLATLGGAIACSSSTHGAGGSGGASSTTATGDAAGSGGCSSESQFFCVSYTPDAGCPTGAFCIASDCPTGCHPEAV